MARARQQENGDPRLFPHCPAQPELIPPLSLVVPPTEAACRLLAKEGSPETKPLPANAPVPHEQVSATVPSCPLSRVRCCGRDAIGQPVPVPPPLPSMPPTQLKQA